MLDMQIEKKSCKYYFENEFKIKKTVHFRGFTFEALFCTFDIKNKNNECRSSIVL